MRDQYVITPFDDGNETQQVKDNLVLDMVTLFEDYDEDMLFLTRDIDELNERKVFLEGVAAYLGKDIHTSAEELLTEVKSRYKEKGITLTRTVKTWFQKEDTSPSTDQAYRRNLYDFCIAMGMDYRTTAQFFLKVFLTIPFNYKDRDDAVYFYCLKEGRPYPIVKQMLEVADSYEATNASVAFTEEIGLHILDIHSDEEFLEYLHNHCYDRKHQYTTAKAKLRYLVAENKRIMPTPMPEELDSKTGKTKSKKKLDTNSRKKNPEARNNRALLDEILGYPYQSLDSNQRLAMRKCGLPTLPRDGDIDKAISNENDVSFDVLRRSLILMKFYNFYRNRQIQTKQLSMETDEIIDCLDDFRYEINLELAECGFVQLYFRNPFDWIILFCANSRNPIYYLQDFIEKRYLGNLK